MIIVTRTSFDMDPFVVTSLGRKILRTKVVRHNLNPVYEEKMVFQVMRHETNWSIQFTVVDRDKLSGNDFIAAANLSIQKLADAAPEADPKTGLYSLPDPPGASPPPVKEKSRFRLPLSRSSSANSLTKLTKPTLKPKASQNSLSSQSQLDVPNGQSPYLAPTSAPPENQMSLMRTDSDLDSEPVVDPDLKSYVVPLDLKRADRWEDKHSPELHIKAKYMPYRALRQQFWRAMLRQYDADESARVSKVELTTMLDTLGSTLRDSTIDGFFKRFADENIPRDTQDLTFDQAVICLEDQLQIGPQKRSMADRVRGMAHGHMSSVGEKPEDSGASTPLPENDVREAANTDSTRTDVPTIAQDSTGRDGEEGKLLDPDDLADEGGEEHVIEIRECPICHQPRLNKRTDADIITHIATCASQDWRQVDSLVMGGFVTSSQAQRKWYSKVITKISYGGYSIGANSANILVQDRLTGQINEERMSVYVRIGIRLLYKALGSREMEKKRSKYPRYIWRLYCSDRPNPSSSQDAAQSQFQARQKV